MSAVLAMSGIAAVRGGRALFAAVDLVLEPGGAVVVSGPNGVGKTSLLRVAAGLLAPVAGTVTRNGRVAWLGEAAALDEERLLVDALAFWARLDGANGATVLTALEAVGLGGLEAVPIRYLSTGQRRRAALARVIASGAPLWLLDEPASGLDTAAQARLAGAIADHRAGGGAVMIATHQPIDLPAATEVRLG